MVKFLLEATDEHLYAILYQTMHINTSHTLAIVRIQNNKSFVARTSDHRQPMRPVLGSASLH
jgi:hypothetical protein